MNRLFIRSVLYSMKRQYGSPIDLYQINTTDMDPATGVRQDTKTKTSIDWAIVLPDTMARKFAYEHSFLFANRPFTYGAQWDEDTRMVIIDGEDLAVGLEISVDDSIVFENKRYTVKTAERFDSGFGFILTVQRVKQNFALQQQTLTLEQ